MTNMAIFNVSTFLITNGLIEDACILHFMFTLWLDSYDLYTLRFEYIGEDNSFQWWDYRVSKFKSWKLTESLKGELKYLKIYLDKKYGALSKLCRASLDGTKISGTFIIHVTPAAIYNRFHRRFWRKLRSFEFTPKDIIRCSQYIYCEFKEDSSRRKLYHYD